MRLRLLALVVLLLLPTVGAAAPCTFGVNCLCDRYAANSSIVFCEDFENPALDDNTGVGWTAKYDDAVSQCRTSTGPSSTGPPTREGPGPQQQGNPALGGCLNVVKANACDNAGDVGCVLDGQQALGNKRSPGDTNGFHGAANLKAGGPYRTFGITMGIRFSPNYESVLITSPDHGPANKGDEWGDAQSSLFGSSISGGPAVQNPPWGGSIQSCEGCTILSVFKGLFGKQDEKIRIGPDSSVYNYNTVGNGVWMCWQIHWANFGTANATYRQWYNGVLTVSASADMTGMTLDQNGYSLFGFNSYYNGPGSSGLLGYPGPTVAYRFEDNIIVTTGSEPISCSEIGFSTIPTWTVNTFSLVNPSVCQLGSCSALADVVATSGGTATGFPIDWSIDCDVADGTGSFTGTALLTCVNSVNCNVTDVCDYSAKAAGTYTAEIHSTRAGITGTAQTTFQVTSPVTGPGMNASGRYTIHN